MEIIKKIFKQTGWQIIGKVVNSISTLIILAWITRQYGETGVGIFTLTLAYLTFFNLAADLGLNAYVLAELSQEPHAANDLFNFRIIWSFVLILLANLIVPFLPFNNSQFQISVLVGSVAILFSAIYNTTNLIFQKHLRYDLSIFASSIESITDVPATLGIALIHAPIGLLMLGQSFGGFINNLVSLQLVKRLYQFRLSLADFEYPLKILKKAWPLSLTLILNLVYFRADAFLLSSFKSFSDVGIYNLAYQFFQTILVIPTFIMNGYFPIMLLHLKTDELKFFKQIRLAFLAMLAFGVVVGIFAFMLAPLVIKTVAGSQPEFSGSVASLQLLSLGFPAFFGSSILMWLLLSLKKYYWMLAIYALGLAINLILNWIYIPQYSYLAAALITSISEYLILLLQLIILFKYSKGKL